MQPATAPISALLHGTEGKWGTSLTELAVGVVGRALALEASLRVDTSGRGVARVCALGALVHV